MPGSLHPAIREALSSLDVSNDESWTGDGLPRVEPLKSLAGYEGLTRKDVTEAAPLFSRSNPVTEIQAPEEPIGDAPFDPLTLDSPPEPASYSSVQQAKARELEQLTADLSQCESETREAEAERDAALKRLTGLGRIRLSIRSRIAKLSPRSSGQQVIVDHLAASQRNREAKGERIKAIQAAGITPEQLEALRPQIAPVDRRRPRGRVAGNRHPLPQSVP